MKEWSYPSLQIKPQLMDYILKTSLICFETIILESPKKN